jgi:hypothetical protein
MTDTPLDTDRLDNGLIISYFDRSRPYFGGYYRVQVEITTTVQLDEGMFANAEAFHQAQRLLGPTVTYRRLVERMGVTLPELAQARADIIDSFRRNALNYLTGNDFPQRFVLGEYAKIIAKPSFHR